MRNYFQLFEIYEELIKNLNHNFDYSNANYVSKKVSC
jgi:hypothetical protein